MRRKQIAVALKGNTGMLIWLGKQLHGQVDSPTTAVNVVTGPPRDTRTPEQVKAELSRLHKMIREEAARENGDSPPTRGYEGLVS